MKTILSLTLLMTASLAFGESSSEPNDVVIVVPDSDNGSVIIRDPVEQPDGPEKPNEPEVSAELLCEGLSNPDRRVALINVGDEIWGRVYEGNELVASGIADKQESTSGSGQTQQTRVSYAAGNITQGGFRIRVVTAYETFPEREGTGNVTVRVDGRFTNDTISCFFFPEPSE